MTAAGSTSGTPATRSKLRRSAQEDANGGKTSLGAGVQPLSGGGGIFKSAAVAVLKQERKLMTTGDITRVALERGLINCQGKTPEATMASALYTDVKRKHNKSVFTRPQEGLFGLREWIAEGFFPEGWTGPTDGEGVAPFKRRGANKAAQQTPQPGHAAAAAGSGSGGGSAGMAAGSGRPGRASKRRANQAWRRNSSVGEDSEEPGSDANGDEGFEHGDEGEDMDEDLDEEEHDAGAEEAAPAPADADADGDAEMADAATAAPAAPAAEPAAAGPSGAAGAQADAAAALPAPAPPAAAAPAAATTSGGQRVLELEVVGVGVPLAVAAGGGAEPAAGGAGLLQMAKQEEEEPPARASPGPSGTPSGRRTRRSDAGAAAGTPFTMTLRRESRDGSQPPQQPPQQQQQQQQQQHGSSNGAMRNLGELPADDFDDLESPLHVLGDVALQEKEEAGGGGGGRGGGRGGGGGEKVWDREPGPSLSGGSGRRGGGKRPSGIQVMERTAMSSDGPRSPLDDSLAALHEIATAANQSAAAAAAHHHHHQNMHHGSHPQHPLALHPAGALDMGGGGDVRKRLKLSVGGDPQSLDGLPLLPPGAAAAGLQGSGGGHGDLFLQGLNLTSPMLSAGSRGRRGGVQYIHPLPSPAGGGPGGGLLDPGLLGILPDVLPSATGDGPPGGLLFSPTVLQHLQHATPRIGGTSGDGLQGDRNPFKLSEGHGGYGGAHPQSGLLAPCLPGPGAYGGPGPDATPEERFQDAEGLQLVVQRLEQRLGRCNPITAKAWLALARAYHSLAKPLGAPAAARALAALRHAAALAAEAAADLHAPWRGAAHFDALIQAAQQAAAANDLPLAQISLAPPPGSLGGALSGTLPGLAPAAGSGVLPPAPPPVTVVLPVGGQGGAAGKGGKGGPTLQVIPAGGEAPGRFSAVGAPVLKLDAPVLNLDGGGGGGAAAGAAGVVVMGAAQAEGAAGALALQLGGRAGSGGPAALVLGGAAAGAGASAPAAVLSLAGPSGEAAAAAAQPPLALSLGGTTAAAPAAGQGSGGGGAAGAAQAPVPPALAQQAQAALQLLVLQPAAPGAAAAAAPAAGGAAGSGGGAAASGGGGAAAAGGGQERVAPPPASVLAHA